MFVAVQASATTFVSQIANTGCDPVTAAVLEIYVQILLNFITAFTT